MGWKNHLVIAALAAVLIAGLMTTATAQEPFEGSDSPGEILGDINTFAGRLHKGLFVVPGLNIQVMFPLHHWEGALSGESSPFLVETLRGS